MYGFYLSCPRATFALQDGCFVPREWLAAKGLFKSTFETLLNSLLGNRRKWPLVEERGVGGRGESEWEYPAKNLLEKGREPETNSTHILRQRWDLNAGHSAFTTTPPMLPIHAYNIIPWENKNSIPYNCM